MTMTENWVPEATLRLAAILRLVEPPFEPMELELTVAVTPFGNPLLSRPRATGSFVVPLVAATSLAVIVTEALDPLLTVGLDDAPSVN